LLGLNHGAEQLWTEKIDQGIAHKGRHLAPGDLVDLSHHAGNVAAVKIAHPPAGKGGFGHSPLVNHINIMVARITADGLESCEKLPGVTLKHLKEAVINMHQKPAEAACLVGHARLKDQPENLGLVDVRSGDALIDDPAHDEPLPLKAET